MAERILVVEDEGIVAMELEQRLRTFGYEVAGIATTADEALALAEEQSPDLILMDVRLGPGPDGAEAAERIQARWDIPIVFVTAYSDRVTVARVKQTAPFGYLVKPFDERILEITVETALFRHRASVERAAAIEARHRTEAWASAILEYSQDAVIATDAQRHITTFNPAAERTFGYRADEIIGSPIELLLPEASVELRVGADTHEHVEVRARRKDASEFVAEVSFSRIARDDEPGFTAIVRDVSARRALQLQYLHAQKMEAVGRLASSVAHDMNNVLLAVEFSAYLLLDGDSPTGRAQAGESIRAAVEQGTSLTRQLLGYSRREFSVAEPVDVNETIAALGHWVRRLLGTRIVVSLCLGDDLGLVGIGRGRLEQVMMNLIINARDAMPNGGALTIRTADEWLDESSAVAAGLETGRYTTVSVSDTGDGIDGKTLARIWEPFFTTKPAGLGTGLGLPTVRELIEAQDGAVVVETARESGTVFRISLPVLASAPCAPRRATVAPRGARSGQGRSLLLVEDDAVVRRTLARGLAQLEYDVIAAATAGEAIVAAERHEGELSLILTDIMLPSMSGTELARVLLRNRPSTCVAFMTGLPPAHLEDRAFDVGDRPVLLKPFSIGELHDKLSELLARH